MLSQDVTIDSSAVPGITLNVGGTDRLLIDDPGVNANVRGLTFTNGYGFQLAGGILNNVFRFRGSETEQLGLIQLAINGGTVSFESDT